jgi:hypothetical protein
MTADAEDTAAAKALNVAAPAAKIATAGAVDAAKHDRGATPMTTDRRLREQAMRRAVGANRNRTTGWQAIRVLSVCLAVGLGSSGAALAQQAGQKTFASAAEAADTLDTAVQNHDQAATLAILGPTGQDLISSGDAVADKNRQDSFAARYSTSHQFAASGDGRTFLYIGTENWPTPIPLRQNGSHWYFDTDYGKRESLYRQIGSDELNVIRVCAAVVDAQREYHDALHDGASEHQYAQRFRSTEGTQNGLFWEVKTGAQQESPLGSLVAEAAYDGYQHQASGQPHPFYGYIYRLLTSQGANASGGPRSYIVDGKMTGGFAMVAYPASDRDSGLMTFIDNQEGQVYQKDLGTDTGQIAGDMMACDPDATWQPANAAATVSASK